MSSSRQICNIIGWLEPHIYCPDGGNGDLQCFSSFLTATFYFAKLDNLVLHIRTIFFGFTPCDGLLREFGVCVPHIYIPVGQEVIARQSHAPSHSYIWKRINILPIRISRGANNCAYTCYFIMIFSIVLLQWKVITLWILEWKVKKINHTDLFSQLPLDIFTQGANISGRHCALLFHCLLLARFQNIARKQTKRNLSYLTCGKVKLFWIMTEWIVHSKAV